MHLPQAYHPSHWHPHPAIINRFYPAMLSPFFAQPAEWQPHSACWLAFPSHADLWEDLLPLAQQEFVELCRGIADPDPDTGAVRGEQLEILVLDEVGKETAQAQLVGLGARFHQIPFGDIWLRDTAPTFLLDQQGHLGCLRFQFNGWGERYRLPGDDRVGERIAKWVNAPERVMQFVAEGGAIEVDGEGTCLTTQQCLLNSNRNPTLAQVMLEAGLKQALGVQKVLWLRRGLLNDHTDGHVDTIARFVAPGRVLCMEAHGADDPNREVLAEIAADLASFTDAQGRSLEVIKIPSPGKLLGDDGEIMPASYVNFYIGNRTVIVPTYDLPYDQEAVATIAQLFPDRRTIGRSAKAILSGGGAFHCITQQQPAAHPSPAHSPIGAQNLTRL